MWLDLILVALGLIAFWWLVDIALMAAMNPVLVPTLFSAVTWSAFSGLMSLTHHFHLSVVGAVAAAALVVRPSVDLLYWAYDLSRLALGWMPWSELTWLYFDKEDDGTALQIGLVWIVWESKSAHTLRLEDGREPIWGYLKLRKRINQAVNYHEKAFSPPVRETAATPEGP